jgi:hypothetical protein
MSQNKHLLLKKKKEEERKKRKETWKPQLRMAHLMGFPYYRKQ